MMPAASVTSFDQHTATTIAMLDTAVADYAANLCVIL